MSFSRCWQRFGRAGSVLTPDPGVREGWHQGRRWYFVWVLRLEDSVVDARMEAVRKVLPLAPSAPGKPHVTVWVQGFEQGAMHPQAGRVVPLEVGGVNSFRSCPFLEVRAPALPAIRAQFVGNEERWAPYLPHLTIGRYDERSETRKLAAMLRPFRGLRGIRTQGRLVLCRVDAFSEEGRLEEVGV